MDHNLQEGCYHDNHEPHLQHRPDGLGWPGLCPAGLVRTQLTMSTPFLATCLLSRSVQNEASFHGRPIGVSVSPSSWPHPTGNHGKTVTLTFCECFSQKPMAPAKVETHGFFGKSVVSDGVSWGKPVKECTSGVDTGERVFC